MKERTLKIAIGFLLALASFIVHAQTETDNARMFLFTDRDYCISGDTLWFKVFLKSGLTEQGDVIHVQLDSPDNNLISTVIRQSRNQWAEGYIFVPDSLSTGVYFLTAFLNSQRNNPGLEALSKSLFVYNRFANEITDMKIPTGRQKVVPGKAGGVQLEINKNEFAPREKVTVAVDCSELNQQGIKNVVVKATKIDELAEEAGGTFKVNPRPFNPEIPFLDESDGFILNGKVTDPETGAPKAGALVLLSIVREPPYFDYSYTGKDGGFYFFLKNAEGTTNVILQAIPEKDEEYKISLGKNYLVRRSNFTMEPKKLTPNQTDFISNQVSGSFFRRLFKNSYVVKPDSFYMPPRFSIPFYGKPNNHIVTAEFIDLPNFQEISRELLPGVQYREKDGEITFRLLNETQSVYFNVEPLRLINGIPVFKNSFFASLKSTDIDYIDVVLKQRLFGDLLFNGILAVSLKDKSNLWLAQQANIFQFSVKCLQPAKSPAYNQEPDFRETIPDIRQVYLWKSMNTATPETFGFYLSDLKGKVEVSVEGVNKNNENVKFSKIIEVK
ncbi:MAG TPA: hypothetical protein VKA38_09640 [Draconibacterium sp.]|nr:hypothetical protein [Draconibacterium sp.]